MFQDYKPELPRKPELPGHVYFAIALTTLRAESGVLHFFPQDTDSTRAEVLEPGDGIICRGEDMNPGVGGEGGIILMIVYREATD
jgi:hypothetical protein